MIQAEAAHLIPISLIFALLACAWILYVYPGAAERRARKNARRTPAPCHPEHKPNTELARHVWTAHLAAEELDYAILCGTAAQIQEKETAAAAATARLREYLARKDNPQ